MSRTIQRVPAGLLAILGAYSSEANPNEVLEGLALTADISRLLTLHSELKSIASSNNITNGINPVVLGPTNTVPDGKIWWVESYAFEFATWNAGTAAGDRVDVGITRYQINLAGQEVAVIHKGADYPQFMGESIGQFWLDSGETMRVIGNASLTAGSVTVQQLLLYREFDK